MAEHLYSSRVWDSQQQAFALEVARRMNERPDICGLAHKVEVEQQPDGRWALVKGAKL